MWRRIWSRSGAIHLEPQKQLQVLQPANITPTKTIAACFVSQITSEMVEPLIAAVATNLVVQLLC